MVFKGLKAQMKAKPFVTLLVLLLTLETCSLKALAGGTESGGGGTGIACFENETQALEARAARKSGRPLPADLISRITTLQVTDYWEHNAGNFIPVQEGEDSSAYLQRVLKNYLAKFAPSFLLKVQNALSRVGLDNRSTVDETGKLKQIDDTGPIAGAMDSEQFGHCAVVQIAVRYARTNSQNKIQTAVDVDQALYAKLGLDHGKISGEEKVINQALLNLHEALYLLGYGLGQKTSEHVRTMTSQLLSLDNFLELEKKSQQHPATLTESGMMAMGEALLLEKNGLDSFPTVEQSHVSSQKLELAHALSLLLAKLGTDIQLPDNLNLPDSVITQLRVAALVQTLQRADETTSFMFVALIALGDGQIKDIYRLLDPTVDSKSDVRTVCHFARQVSKDFEGNSYVALILRAASERSLRFKGCL